MKSVVNCGYMEGESSALQEKNKIPPQGRVVDEKGRFVFAPGVSGNPKGRPRGKTLKEFAREYLMNLPDEEKMAYLAKLPQEIVWKMAEGNPHNTQDVTTDGKAFPTPILGITTNVVPTNDSNKASDGDAETHSSDTGGNVSQ